MLPNLPDDVLRCICASLPAHAVARLRQVLRLDWSCAHVAAHARRTLVWGRSVTERCAVDGCGAHVAKCLWYFDERTNRHVCIERLPYCPAHARVFCRSRLLTHTLVFYCVTERVLEEHWLEPG